VVPFLGIFEDDVSFDDAKVEHKYHNQLNEFRDAIRWFTRYDRIGVYLLIRFFQATLVPFLELATAVILKLLVVGTIQPGPRPTSGRAAFDLWLVKELVPGKGLRGVANLVGTHYEMISIIYRLLGAKVGSRVYWPGSGIDLGGCFDLFEVGDDVTFGSRSIIMPADAFELSKVVIGDGAMVADRCVLLPGTIVGRRATVGSGSLAARGFTFPPGSTYVGSRNGGAVELQGKAEESQDTSLIAPFGRAFYFKEAPYRVITQAEIFIFNTVVAGFSKALHAFPLPVALMLSALADRAPAEYGGGGGGGGGGWYTESAPRFLIVLIPSFVLTFTVNALLCLMLDVGSKWVLLGRRTAGPHPWDQDSYCQRWQLYLTFSSNVRSDIGGGRGVLDFIRGSGYLLTYFRSLGAKIDVSFHTHACCIYCLCIIAQRVLFFPFRIVSYCTQPVVTQ
jgi:serine acetyltransferase